METEIRVEDALKVLEEKTNRDRQFCWEEIAAALDKYNFGMEVTTIIRGERILHQIDLNPKGE